MRLMPEDESLVLRDDYDGCYFTFIKGDKGPAHNAAAIKITYSCNISA